VCVFSSSAVYAVKEKIHLTLVAIESKRFLPLASVKKIHSGLSVHFEKDEGQGELRFKNRVVLFRTGDEKYQVQDEVHELEAAGVIEDDGLYFSREFIEEVLTELALPVSYRFHKSTLIIVREKERDTKTELDFIFIDAGHGGRDSGALGYFDAAEKDITLSLARALKSQLESDFPKTKIYLTRSTDKFLRLEKRSDLANRKSTVGKFGIFVSVHCNSTLSPRVKGFEVYYLAQNPDNRKMRELMLRENEAHERSAYIKKLTSRLMNAQIQRESKSLARGVFKGIGNRLDGMIKPRKVKKADFAVLRGSLMPAILIETGYLTNKDDLKRLKSDEYKQNFVQGVSQGIGIFLSDLAKAEK